MLALLLPFLAVAASTSQCTAKLRDLASGIVPGTNRTRVATRFVLTASCGLTFSIACSTILTASFSCTETSVLVLSLLSAELPPGASLSVCLTFCFLELDAISRTKVVRPAVLHACKLVARADVPCQPERSKCLNMMSGYTSACYLQDKLRV